jgi:hypothetical protein
MKNRILAIPAAALAIMRSVKRRDKGPTTKGYKSKAIRIKEVLIETEFFAHHRNGLTAYPM